jgi:hypothetical protein
MLRILTCCGGYSPVGVVPRLALSPSWKRTVSFAAGDEEDAMNAQRSRTARAGAVPRSTSLGRAEQRPRFRAGLAPPHEFVGVQRQPDGGDEPQCGECRDDCRHREQEREEERGDESAAA